MDEIKEYLPFLIPLVIVQLSLLGWCLHHILKHDRYKRGTRPVWIIVCIVLMGFVGPILYITLGKEDE
ncbi:MAG: PLDc N-terminal domain-containing protein [Ruminococcus sp.]|nr:PLDc N-terminal domain-containing protein [Ruminococcus sp.]